MSAGGTVPTAAAISDEAWAKRPEEIARLDRAAQAAHNVFFEAGQDTGWPSLDRAERAVRQAVERRTGGPGRRKLAVFVAEYDRLRAKVADLIGVAGTMQRERDEARAQVAELASEVVNARANALVEQTDLKGLTVEEGAVVLELGPPRALVIAWVDAARKMLGDAPNYSETRVDFPGTSMEIKAAGELERYVFTVQRAGKVTPHEARVAAETERDTLRGQVAVVRALCQDAMKLPTLDDPRPADDRISPRAVLGVLDAATPDPDDRATDPKENR